MLKTPVTRYTRHTCPRNCYSSCSMISHVQEDQLIKVTGDTLHGFSKGKLCAKGYHYPEFVYSKRRLKYPLMRTGKRGEGCWRRVSWEEAYEMLATRLLESYERRGSFRSVSYNTFSGNIGFQAHAMQAFFASLGPHTYSAGNPCLGTGKLALEQQRGFVPFHQPEIMAEAGAIVIWGANPAVTNIHQMKYIHAARDKGAKLVVIDPVFTETAKAADVYIQLNPGTDVWLAADILNRLVREGNIFEQKGQIEGKEALLEDLRSLMSGTEKSRHGVQEGGLQLLSDIYRRRDSVVSWIGFGMQRYVAGDIAVRMVDCLAMLTEGKDRKDRPVYYLHNHFFTLHEQISRQMSPPKAEGSREVSYHHFAGSCLKFEEDPLDFLWVFNRNPLSQDESVEDWYRLIESLQFIAVSDLTLTQTAQYADLVLPVTSHFEHTDVHASYWSQWISLNEPAIPPYWESRSDLRIATELSNVLEQKKPGVTSFPLDMTEKKWLEQVVDIIRKTDPDLTGWETLRIKPHQLKVPEPEERRTLYKTAGETRSFLSDLKGHSRKIGKHTFQILSAQSLLHIHSQFETGMAVPDNLQREDVGIGVEAAGRLGIKEGDPVLIYNEAGEVRRRTKILEDLPDDILLMRQGGSDPVNRLIKEPLHHGVFKNETQRSTSFFDNRASLIKADWGI